MAIKWTIRQKEIVRLCVGAAPLIQFLDIDELMHLRRLYGHARYVRMRLMVSVAPDLGSFVSDAVTAMKSCLGYRSQTMT